MPDGFWEYIPNDSEVSRCAICLERRFAEDGIFTIVPPLAPMKIYITEAMATAIREGKAPNA